MSPGVRRPVLAALAVATLASCGGGEVDPDPGDVIDDGSLDRPAHDGEWELAIDGAADGAFMSVWGAAPDDVWVVGGQTSVGDRVGDGVVYRYRGETWERVETPAGPMLNWVYGVGAEVWVVGEAGRSLRFRGGSAAEEIATGVDVTLWGVWGATADDLWAVGGDPLARSGAPVIVHWDGEVWSQVAVPPLDRDGVRALFKVWGSGPDDVFALGSAGVVIRWDGAAWTQQETDVRDDLISLWGRGPSEIIAVGGRAVGVVGRWDGASWRFEALEQVSGLNGSWMAGDGTAWVVGTGGRILRLGAGSFEFEDEESPTRNVLHATFGLDGGPGFAVGGTLLSPPPFSGDVLLAR